MVAVVAMQGLKLKKLQFKGNIWIYSYLHHWLYYNLALKYICYQTFTCTKVLYVTFKNQC